MWPPIIETLSGILKKWLRREDLRDTLRNIEQGISGIQQRLDTHEDHMILLIDAIQSDQQHQNNKLEALKDKVKKSRRPPPNTS